MQIEKGFRITIPADVAAGAQFQEGMQLEWLVAPELLVLRPRKKSFFAAGK
ncbi:MAG: AbrB/MazE/SpoVT family DNA-binding domain-containing protein [Deferribacteraceae bacterium]|nr:AbrB/MazE/SpoVT family DNA-binding domain-containing protein [Deferribacteraceae bacterium]